jgi:hypothetical protein
MKKLIFLVLVIFALSCEKNKENNWECKKMFILSIPGCPALADTLRSESISLENKTHDEAWTYELSQNYITTVFQGNVPFQLESKCHCLPAYCPEY